MRETWQWAVAAAAILAVIIYNMVWVLYPACSWCKLDHRTWAWVLVFLSPSLYLAWSLIPHRQPTTYVWARRTVIAHALGCAALIGLGAFGIAPLLTVAAELAIVIDAILLGVSPAAASGVVGFFARSVAVGGGGTVATLLVWSLANVALVSRQATALAMGRAYCIQVARNGLGDYTEATSLHALSGLRMQTPHTNAGGSSDFQFAFHGVLVIEDKGGTQYHNWSYRRLRFEPVGERTLRALHLRRPSCSPKPHFVGQLAWI